MLTKQQLLDAAERISWTFIQAAGGVILASQSFGVQVWKAAAYAGGLAAVKVLVGLKVNQSPAVPPSK